MQLNAEAAPPDAPPGQAVSTYNDDMLMHHGIWAWHEQAYDGKTSGGKRFKVGIIDTGFDGWRMSARPVPLPEPPNLGEENSFQVKTKCWIEDSDGFWSESDFDGC